MFISNVAVSASKGNEDIKDTGMCQHLWLQDGDTGKAEDQYPRSKTVGITENLETEQGQKNQTC